MHLATVLTCLLLALPASALAATIERLEPASWWVGMRHDRVELMVHGEGIAALTPRLSHPGVAITGVERDDNRNYLFVTVHVAGEARPGVFAIEFRVGGEVVARHRWRLDARAPGSAERRGFGPGDAIYLVTPDRFANGDPGNDSVPGMREAADRSAPDGRHGGD